MSTTVNMKKDETDNNMKIVIGIPAYNEEKNIPDLSLKKNTDWKLFDYYDFSLTTLTNEKK